MMTNRRDYIEAAFDEVRQRYGTMDAYLHQGLGVDDGTPTRLRKALLVS